jgi:hypothetical protein
VGWQIQRLEAQTALAQGGMSERLLRAFSRHRDGKSLDHYAKAKATPEAIVRAMRGVREG